MNNALRQWSGHGATAGRWTLNATCPAPAATHDFATLVIYTEGSATIRQREAIEIGPGDIQIIPAGEKHQVERARGVVSWGVRFCVTCYAPGEVAALLAPFERVRAGASAVVRLPTARQEHLIYLCKELGEETSSGPREHGDEVQKSLLTLILAEVARGSALAPSPELAPSMVSDALRYIERHCLGPLTLKEVAGAVKRSPAHLTTTLRQATGRSAGEWIIAGRMAEARRRLVQSDEMIEVIAERVGYADATHFTRLFRRLHGETPTAWRGKHRPTP